jgi:hypothetical protein
MADDDSDAIFVDIVPKLDEAAADEIATSLRDKFKDAADGLKDGVKDAAGPMKDIFKEYAHDAFDEFKSGAKDAAKDIGDSFAKGDIHGGFERMRDILSGTTGAVTGVGETFGVHLDNVKDFGKAGADALNSIEHAVQGFKDTVGGLADSLHGLRSGDLASRLGSAGDLTKQISGVFGIGGEGEPLGSIADVLSSAQTYATLLPKLKGFKGGDIAGAIAATQGLLAQGDSDLGNQPGSEDSVAGTISKILGSAGAGAATFGAAGSVIPGITTGPAAAVGALGFGIPAAVQALGPQPRTPQQRAKDEIDRDQHTQYYRDLENDQHLPGFEQQLLAAGQRPGKPPILAPDRPVASALAAPPTLAAAAAPAAASPSSMSAGSVSITAGSVSVSGASVSVSGGGAYGGGGGGLPSLTRPGFKSWHTGGIIGFDDGGIVPGGSPGMDNTLGMLPNGRPVGLEGGEGVINTQAMAQPGMPQAVANANSGASPTQQQSIGQGQGFGITGGGMIGAAEQAAVMAAGIGGFGGGAIAAQIGIQETNLAIQEAGKAAAIGAMIPSETLSLAGGQMGAPAIGQGGWFKKVAGGLIGQGFNSLNVAGATQPPKQPQPGDTHPGSDPGSASTGGGPKPGPSGHPDDPVHTAPAPGTGGQQQGAANSAMGGISAMASLGG